MARSKHANEPPPVPPTGADRPVVLGDLLGTSRERGPGNGTRIEPLTASAVPAEPVPAAGSAERAPAARPPGRGRGPVRRVVGALAFAGIAAAGVYVGVNADSVGDALQTVSVVLVATAVLIYLAAFVLWIRGRSRAGAAPAPAVTVPTAADPVAVPAAPMEASGPGQPHVPTLAEVAAELDATTRSAPPAGETAPPATVLLGTGTVTAATTVPPPPPVTPSAPRAVRPPPPPPAAEPVAAEPVAAEPAGAADVPAPVDEPTPAAVVPQTVLDAIAPYTEVVGSPVIRAVPVATAPPAPPAPVAQPAGAAVPPPPPPTRPIVPPPPPPASGAAVPPPPPAAVPSPPPAATTAAEVFAAMAAAGEPRNGSTSLTEPAAPPPIETVAEPAARPGSVTRPDPDEAVDLFADQAADAAPADGEVGPAGVAPTVPLPVVKPWVPPVPAADSAALAQLAGADVAARSAVGSVAPVVVYRYRKWVLGQMMPGTSFGPVDVDRSPDEWLLLATCGVATLLAWTHEDHHFTYPVETWVDEILPAHGVRIRDRELAHDLVLAAALHAGGVDSVPTERLRSYAPADLVTAMASIHVGLLRLYCGLGRIEPERVLADQYGIGPGDIPLH